MHPTVDPSQLSYFLLYNCNEFCIFLFCIIHFFFFGLRFCFLKSRYVFYCIHLFFLFDSVVFDLYKNIINLFLTIILSSNNQMNLYCICFQ